jgi:hypothetical protein
LFLADLDGALGEPVSYVTKKMQLVALATVSARGTRDIITRDTRTKSKTACVTWIARIGAFKNPFIDLFQLTGVNILQRGGTKLKQTLTVKMESELVSSHAVVALYAICPNLPKLFE